MSLNTLTILSPASPVQDGLPRFDASLFKTRFACEIKNYDPEKFGIDKKDAHRNDPFTQYAMIAAHEALMDSRLDLDALDKDRVGVIVGSGIGGIETLLKEIGSIIRAAWFPGSVPFLFR